MPIWKCWFFWSLLSTYFPSGLTANNSSWLTRDWQTRLLNQRQAKGHEMIIFPPQNFNTFVQKTKFCRTCRVIILYFSSGWNRPLDSSATEPGAGCLYLSQNMMMSRSRAGSTALCRHLFVFGKSWMRSKSPVIPAKNSKDDTIEPSRNVWFRLEWLLVQTFQHSSLHFWISASAALLKSLLWEFTTLWAGSTTPPPIPTTHHPLSTVYIVWWNN